MGALDCRICGKENPEHVFYCSGCYKCEDCGTENGLTMRRGELTCQTCHEKRAEAVVAKFTGDTDFTTEITCPWCGCEQGDSWEANDSDEHECDYCGREYEHTRDVDVTYCTEKIVR
jgi:DNA-directed RNA polymerase subunit RPC12/RpoP